MLNIQKLKGKIVEQDKNIKKMAEVLGMNASTFYRKMKNNSFEIREVDTIVRELNLSRDDASAIFFAQTVS